MAFSVIFSKNTLPFLILKFCIFSTFSSVVAHWCLEYLLQLSLTQSSSSGHQVSIWQKKTTLALKLIGYSPKVSPEIQAGTIKVFRIIILKNHRYRCYLFPWLKLQQCRDVFCPQVQTLPDTQHGPDHQLWVKSVQAESHPGCWDTISSVQHMSGQRARLRCCHDLMDRCAWENFSCRTFKLYLQSHWVSCYHNKEQHIYLNHVTGICSI